MELGGCKVGAGRAAGTLAVGDNASEIVIEKAVDLLGEGPPHGPSSVFG